MHNLKKYSKPFMISEQFEPNSYCVTCNPKEIVSYTLSNRFDSYQHFVLDKKPYDQECTEYDLDNVKKQTTDQGLHGQTLTTHVLPELCWPAYNSNPQQVSDVNTNMPLWFATDDSNHSGHVYAFENMTINYSHS